MDPLIGSTLLKVGGSLLGGLFGRKKKTESSIVDFKALRDRAEAAGFNPLTALKATGGAGFTQTTHPGLSSGEFLAEALGAAGDGLSDFAKANDPIQKERDQLEMDLMRAELDRIKSEAGVTQGFAGGVPTARHEKVPAVQYSGGERARGNVMVPGTRFEETQVVGVAGDPDLISAQSAEDDFGDGPGWWQGAGNYTRVLFRNWNDPMREEEYDGGFLPKSGGMKNSPPARPRRWVGSRSPRLDAYGQPYVLPPLGSSY